MANQNLNPGISDGQRKGAMEMGLEHLITLERKEVL